MLPYSKRHVGILPLQVLFLLPFYYLFVLWVFESLWLLVYSYHHLEMNIKLLFAQKQLPRVFTETAYFFWEVNESFQYSQDVSKLLIREFPLTPNPQFWVEPSGGRLADFVHFFLDTLPINKITFLAMFVFKICLFNALRNSSFAFWFQYSLVSSSSVNELKNIFTEFLSRSYLYLHTCPRLLRLAAVELQQSNDEQNTCC